LPAAFVQPQPYQLLSVSSLKSPLCLPLLPLLPPLLPLLLPLLPLLLLEAGGDSAGGNLALAGLSLLRDAGKLSKLPLGLTLISPAVDLSNTSVFGSREPVSSHFDPAQTQSHSHGSSSSPTKKKPGCQDQESNPGRSGETQNGSAGSAEEGEEVTRPSPGSAQLLTGSSFKQQQQSQPQQQQQQQQQGVKNVAQRQLEQQHVPLTSQPSIDCKMHGAHTAGGKLRPGHLVKGILGDVVTALRVHSSRSSAQQQAATGYFDYIPSDSFADELHCYIQVSAPSF